MIDTEKVRLNIEKILSEDLIDTSDLSVMLDETQPNSFTLIAKLKDKYTAQNIGFNRRLFSGEEFAEHMSRSISTAIIQNHYKEFFKEYINKLIDEIFINDQIDRFKYLREYQTKTSDIEHYEFNFYIVPNRSECTIYGLDKNFSPVLNGKHAKQYMKNFIHVYKKEIDINALKKKLDRVLPKKEEVKKKRIKI